MPNVLDLFRSHRSRAGQVGLAVLASAFVACRPERPMVEAELGARRIALTPVRCIITREGANCGSGQTVVASSMAEALAKVGDAPPPVTPAGDRVRDVLLGGAEVFVRLLSDGASYDTAAQELALDLRVQNLMNQAMGSTDGQSTHPDSLQVAIVTNPPVATGGTVAAIGLPTRDFGSGGPVPYRQYPGPLPGNAVSEARRWRFVMPRSVTSFALDRRVWAEVPDESLLASAPSQAWTDVSAGPFVTCGVRGGKLFCWGNPNLLLTGDGSATFQPVPARVGGLPPMTLLTAGMFHTCGLDTSGRAWCWGNNSSGELGGGSALSRRLPTPVAMPAGVTFTTLASTLGSTCALDTAGDAWCWGANNGGQIGDGTRFNRLTPVRVRPPVGTAPFAQLSGSRSNFTQGMCGRTSTGDLLCWGLNSSVRYGVGSATDTLVTPTAITGGPWSDIAIGSVHSCLLDALGAASCAGLGGLYLGDGVGTTNRTTPFPVTGGLRFRSISAAGLNLSNGSAYTCAITRAETPPDSAAYCWGSSLLGAGSTNGSSVPVAVAGGLRFRSIETSPVLSTCGLTGDGRVFCWGTNTQAEVGLGRVAVPRPWVLSPTQVAELPPSDQVVVGSGYACARASGDVWCWGTLTNWNLGVPFSFVRSRPAGVLAAGSFGSVSIMRVNTSPGAACASATSGVAQCWGTATNGILGDGDVATPPAGGTRDALLPRSVAAPVGGPAGPIVFGRMALSRTVACALSVPNREAYCWGTGFIGNGLGQATYLVPQYLGTRRYTHVAVSNSSSCALGEVDSVAYCWGPAGVLLGRTGAANTLSPTAVTMPAGVRFVDLDGSSSGFCAAGSNGRVYCWGNNSGQGLAGLETTTTIAEPRLPEIPALQSLAGVTRVTVGTAMGCALTPDGLTCWGQNFPSSSVNSQSAPNAVQQFPALAGAIAISAGSGHVCAVSNVGSLWCVGLNSGGQLGTGSLLFADPVPRQVLPP